MIKKLYLCLIIYELLWFLVGDINIVYLKENGVKIWDDWVDENGDFGLVYGYQWWFWLMLDGGLIDQIFKFLDMIWISLESCWLIVLVWNLVLVDEMVLLFCYVLFQFYVVDGKLFCQFYQCLVDVFLGVLFNIVFYVLLIMMIVQVIGLKFGDFVYMLGDVYLYFNYFDQVCEQFICVLCFLLVMMFNLVVISFFVFKFENFELIGYDLYFYIVVLIVV